MRVVHISRFFHPSIGGTEDHIAELATYIAPYEIESYVLSSARKADRVGPAPRLPVHRLRVLGSDRLLVPYRGISEAVRILRTADVVHVHDLRFLLELASAVSLVGRTPLVLSTHGLIFHTPRTRVLKEAVWRTYYRSILHRFATILCDSSHDAAHCRRIGLEEKLRLVPNPVDVEVWERTVPAGPRSGALLFYGRLAPNKGLDRLSALLDRAPAGWTLTIAGAGEAGELAGYRQHFAAFGPRVRFTGTVPSSDLPGLFGAHDCVVLPSRAEGFGLTLVQAMASGIPVVASDIPSYREIAAGSPVALVDFDQPDACLRAIERSRQEWDRQAARRRARDFSWRERAQEFAEIYAEIAR